MVAHGVSEVGHKFRLKSKKMCDTYLDVSSVQCFFRYFFLLKDLWPTEHLK